MHVMGIEKEGSYCSYCGRDCPHCNPAPPAPLPEDVYKAFDMTPEQIADYETPAPPAPLPEDELVKALREWQRLFSVNQGHIIHARIDFHGNDVRDVLKQAAATITSLREALEKVELWQIPKDIAAATGPIYLRYSAEREYIRGIARAARTTPRKG